MYLLLYYVFTLMKLLIYIKKGMIIKNFNFILILSNIIFLGGITSLLLSKNAINWLISIELIFLSIFLNFIIFAIYYLDTIGFLYSLLTLIIAAAESALCLTLILLNYKITKNINLNLFKKINNL